MRRPPDERVGVGVGLNAGDGGSSLMLLRDVDSLGVEPTGVRLSTPPFKGGCVERLAALPPPATPPPPLATVTRIAGVSAA